MSQELRALPEALEAEKLILAVAMTDPTMTRRLATELTAQEFAGEKHRLIWYVISDLAREDRTVSRVTVTEELNRRGKLDTVGGLSYLADLDSSMGLVFGVDEYVRLVREKAVLRRLLYACQSISEICYTGTADEALVEAQRLIQGTAEGFADANTSGMKHAADVLRDAGGFDGLFSPARRGIQTPWKELNDLTLGLHRGQMIVLAGRTGRGKSAAAVQICECGLRQHSGSVAVFSLEMRAEANLKRMSCAAAGVDANLVRRGQLSADQRRRLAKTANSLAGDELWFSERMNVTIPSLYRGLQYLRNRGPIALACVDYLQLMSSGGHVENRQQEVAAISRGLKQAAVHFDIPILVLVQYNRDVDKGDTRPALRHIRESGAIEHDADMAWLLHEPDGISEGGEGWKTEWIVEKQREGPTRPISLWFDRPRTRFMSMDER